MIKKVGIVGAGVMGVATALELARHGIIVFVKDISPQVISCAQNNFKREFRTACMLSDAYKSINYTEIINNVRFQVDYSGFDEADLVIENISEDVCKKINEYKNLVSHCKENVIYALNTSCIPITKLAASFSNPSRVIGMHMMNPVYHKSLVEVINGMHTSSDTTNTLQSFLLQIGKKPVIINDGIGFVSNRLSHTLMNEAAFIVQSGVSTASQVDEIMRGAFGHHMGPLETADLIGLDTVVASLNILYEMYQDSKYRCCPLLRQLVDAGHHGRKTGRGFFSYQ